jgi:AcrR family transcriptional regulator
VSDDALSERILDVAAEQLLRYGYSKTTLDAVARAAGVAKGTLYLRWRSREDLFVAALHRERAAMRADVAAELAGVEHADLRALVAGMVRAYRRRDLVSAMVLRDSEVLGGLARAADDHGLTSTGFVGFLRVLREQGLIDTERSLAEQVTVVSAAFLGYFHTAPMIPPSLQIDDSAAEVVAETIHRMLVRREPLTPAEEAAMDAATRAYVIPEEDLP